MINRISQIYQDRQTRKRSAQPQNEPRTLAPSEEPEIEQKNEFVPAEKQRHFGILHYTMNDRFRKIFLIGLANVLLLVAFFLFMFFFVVRVKCEDKNGSSTVPPRTTKGAELDETTTTVAPLLNYTCSDEFKLVYQKCLLERIDLPHRQGAEDICNSLGAILMTVKSSEENQAFRAWMANRHHSVWIGMTCENGEKNNCEWDDLEKWPFPYEAFLDGYPNSTCIQYNISNPIGKEWYSRNCEEPTSYVCEQPRTVSASCTHNFNMHCYYYFSSPKTFPEAQDTCRSQCGNLLSIESIRENIYVQSIKEIQTDWIYLGGFATSQDHIVWMDGSSMGWNNLQEYDDKKSCLLLRMGTRGGNWSTTECSESRPFVCKVPIGKQC